MFYILHFQEGQAEYVVITTEEMTKEGYIAEFGGGGWQLVQIVKAEALTGDPNHLPTDRSLSN